MDLKVLRSTMRNVWAARQAPETSLDLLPSLNNKNGVGMSACWSEMKMKVLVHLRYFDALYCHRNGSFSSANESGAFQD
jgi:hypothetical protein